MAELVGKDGNVLHREYAAFVPILACEPGDAQRFRVEAYIQLREEVRLRRDDIVLWRESIRERPTLKVSATVLRGETIFLRASFSRPHEGANMLVVYHWRSGRFQPVYVGDPIQSLEIDAADLPGGKECRFAVTYSNGLRSASTATDSFSVPLKGPSVAIVRPSKEDSVIAGTPVIFEGIVSDRERAGGPRIEEELIWSLDGEVFARGLIASVDAVAVGGHVVELAYRAEPGAVAQLKISAKASRETLASDWPDWDPLSER